MDDLDAGRTDEQPFIYDSPTLTAISWSKEGIIIDVHLFRLDGSSKPYQVIVAPQSTEVTNLGEARKLRELLDCAIWLAEQWQREIDEVGES